MTNDSSSDADNGSRWKRRRKESCTSSDDGRKRRRKKREESHDDEESSRQPRKRRSKSSKRHTRREYKRYSDSSDDGYSSASSTDSEPRHQKRKRKEAKKKKRKKEKKQKRRGRSRDRERRKADHRADAHHQVESKPDAHDEAKRPLPAFSDSGKVDVGKSDVSSHPIEQQEPRRKAATMVPMTREQYEKQQSQVREVFDEESGRYRLVRGSGEIIERIVSRSDHHAINSQATRGDGSSFARHVFSASASKRR
jgi:hypothetical protein